MGRRCRLVHRIIVKRHLAAFDLLRSLIFAASVGSAAEADRWSACCENIYWQSRFLVIKNVLPSATRVFNPTVNYSSTARAMQDLIHFFIIFAAHLYLNNRNR